MGAWGYSALETDEGQDIKDRWQAWLDQGYDNNKIIDMLLKHWGDAINYGDSITNNEIIASALLCVEKKITLPKELSKAAINAINNELETDELERWEKPQERTNTLTTLLDELGGKREKKRKFHLFKDPVLNYKSASDAKKQLIKLSKKMQKSKYPLSYSKVGFPDFFSTLDRYMNHKLSGKDTSLFIEAKKQRLMMLSTYLILNLNASEEELEKLFDAIEEKF